MSVLEEVSNREVTSPVLETSGRISRVAPCETCGNAYDKAFEVVLGGVRHVFDCFECAIHALAPTCGHCRCRIIGHGVEIPGAYFCCAHCAQEAGADGMRDRTGGPHP